MTYNVFGGTLSLTQSVNHVSCMRHFVMDFDLFIDWTELICDRLYKSLLHI